MIILADENDLNNILILFESFIKEHKNFNDNFYVWDRTIVEKLKSQILEGVKNNLFFLLKENEQIIGFIEYKRNDSSLSIINLFIKKQERKKGYGKKLVEETLKNFTYSNLVVNVDINNVNAINFYESIGFNKFSLKLVKLESS